MIRLTVNVQSDPEIHLFNKSTILLGSESGHVDLILPGENIQPVHLKIIEQNGFLILINQANDPFVSINDHPFGKKLLRSGDIILVHQTKILFENLNQASEEKEKAPLTPLDTLIPILNDKIKKQIEVPQAQVTATVESEENKSSFHFSLPFEKEVEALKEEEWKLSDLDRYLSSSGPSQKEQEKKTDAALAVAPFAEEKVFERKKPLSLKDDYLRDLDDDNKKEDPFHISSEPSHLVQAWKWIILFILSILAIAGILGTVIYFTVSDKTEMQETKAAQGMADIAMALAHAQLYHIKPPNQNWSDLDFLKNNLQVILPNVPSYASQLDAQGQFNCCPYSLRIYTSSDLSHFLLIAQPAPSLLHWLIPKSIIVIDSHSMELRTLKDVRSLNRLLTNPDPLESMNGKEISSLIKQGELIRLATLANETGNLDYAPPKNLGWIKPGAENFIYNAPRYHRLGQRLIQKALALSTSRGTSQEVAALKQDVESFSSLNNLILYADQGKKSALLTRQGVMTFAPSDKFLFGYLLFNNQGKIYQVHLLKDEEELKDPIASLNKENDLIAFHAATEKNHKDEQGHALEESQIDFNHPIYIKLQSLAMARENELQPLTTALTNLLNHELPNPRTGFQFEFQNLSHAYLMADAKHKQAIKEALDSLYHQYEDMPINQFMAFVKHLHLEQLIQQDNQAFSLADENCIQNLETMLVHIEKAKSLSELDNLIHIATTWLNFDYIKDPQDLMKYQNLLRNQILNQLENQLLSQTKHLAVRAEDRDVLQHILNYERLIKPEEKDFFLNEFDALLAMERPKEEEPPEEAAQ
ncbi:FHA domain-containing protein [Candidatus Protochlamydia phocaeensis]|uniref:FHA domain-containing protein n=1 Tax=Candidatus Protochlamydia phocaeensis TaxID=1414722 RepID=UPI0008394D6F|nr:FHA domain-containing protein [Candidatus Protochlamydia phocaeensis]